MYTPGQIWRHATPKTQLLIALSLATVLAFSVGLAAGIYGRAIYSPALNASRIVPADAPAPQALPAVAGSGSAYDGSAYVEYLTARPAASNPNVPAIATGSAYDGGHYRDVSTHRVVDPAAQGVMDYLRAHRDVPARIMPDPAAQGVMDYLLMHGALVAPALNSNVPIIGTGSAYDGQK